MGHREYYYDWEKCSDWLYELGNVNIAFGLVHRDSLAKSSRAVSPHPGAPRTWPPQKVSLVALFDFSLLLFLPWTSLLWPQQTVSETGSVVKSHQDPHSQNAYPKW